MRGFAERGSCQEEGNRILLKPSVSMHPSWGSCISAASTQEENWALLANQSALPLHYFSCDSCSSQGVAGGGFGHP